MNSLTDFVRNMTIWNWLALIAFIFLPLSALNAFFGLRSRYRDWKGTRTKIQFDKRLKQFELQLKNLEDVRADPFRMTVHAVRVTAMFALFTALAMLSLAFALFLSLSFSDRLLEGLGCLFGMFFLSVIINRALALFARLRKFSLPHHFAIEIIDFVKHAEDRGLTSDGADKLILRLMRNRFFPQSSNVVILDYIAHQLPRVAALENVECQRNELAQVANSDITAEEK